MNTKEQIILVPPLKTRRASFKITGTAPYMQRAFGKSAKQEIKRKHEAGSQAKSKNKKEPKDFEKLFKEATHFSEEGWIGIPAVAFRNAMIEACRLVGFKMTLAKCSIWIIPDGIDAENGSPLIKIYGKVEKHIEITRIQKTIDLPVRPMWRKWSAVVTVQWDEDQFSETDMANLLARAGWQIGIGEGRPFSIKSAGIGFGTFEIDEK